MTHNELATFLRETAPSLRVLNDNPQATAYYPNRMITELLSALDTAIGLLRESLDASDPTTDPWHPERRDKLLATLRLVVGEKERA